MIHDIADGKYISIFVYLCICMQLAQFNDQIIVWLLWTMQQNIAHKTCTGKWTMRFLLSMTRLFLSFSILKLIAMRGKDVYNQILDRLMPSVQHCLHPSMAAMWSWSAAACQHWWWSEEAGRPDVIIKYKNFFWCSLPSRATDGYSGLGTMCYHCCLGKSHHFILWHALQVICMVGEQGQPPCLQSVPKQEVNDFVTY